MRKSKFFVFIIFCAIILFGLVAYWHFKSFKESLTEAPLAQFEIPELKISSPKEIEEILKGTISKEFVSPDGRLKMEYPSNWIEIKKEDVEKFISPETAKKYGLKYLFLAQKVEIGKFAQLIVSELTIEAQKNFKEIIEEMKEFNLQQGWKMEIIESIEKENVFTFEAKYQKPDRENVHSKEKMIFFEPIEGSKKVYLIAVIVFERDWEGLSKEADSIIDSIQLID